MRRLEYQMAGEALLDELAVNLSDDSPCSHWCMELGVLICACFSAASFGSNRTRCCCCCCCCYFVSSSLKSRLMIASKMESRVHLRWYRVLGLLLFPMTKMALVNFPLWLLVIKNLNDIYIHDFYVFYNYGSLSKAFKTIN